ncbi:hypothetical protein C8R42DRAFT_637324 [Lentinula raphanica]|nr:hypothetical protein C8R42DRAFT_637324 [Lentinula raphanica]
MHPSQNLPQNPGGDSLRGKETDSGSSRGSDRPNHDSSPSSDSATSQSTIKGTFFAGSHHFNINNGSFDNSNGDINKKTVNDYSHRSNFGNRYGDNRSNSNNTTNNYNGRYNDQSRYDPAPPAHAGRRGRASAPPNPQQRPTPLIPAAASMSRGSREAPEVRSSTAPLPIRSRPEEDVHSLFLRDEGDDPRYEYEFNYPPHFGGHYSPNYYYDDEEGDHRAHDEDEEMYVEEQSQPRFAEPRAYRAGPSEPGPSQAASPGRQFKSNNPFAKMMANQQ